MSDALHLALDALSGHPAELARLLEDEEPASAAALLESAPAGTAAAVLAAMLPTPAAHCLSNAPPSWAGALLGRLSTTEAAAILRCLPGPKRRQILTYLPTRRALALRIVLDYPPDTVGAWMEPRAVAVRSDATVGAAQAVARGAEGCELFAVSRGRHLDGIVRMPRLMRAQKEAPLAPLVETGTPALPAWSAIRSAPQADGWRAYNALPVVDRAGNLVGELPAGILSQAVAEPVRIGPEGEGIGWAVVQAYVSALGGLFGVLIGEGRSGS